MNDKSNISPKAWELLNNLTASVHRHVENHNSADYAEKARAEDALANYIASLESEVEASKSMIERLIDDGDMLASDAKDYGGFMQNVQGDIADWHKSVAEWINRKETK